MAFADTIGGVMGQGSGWGILAKAEGGRGPGLCIFFALFSDLLIFDLCSFVVLLIDLDA
jgi:hypothetical protein